MRLTTKRLLIRPFLESDLNDVHEYCAAKGVGVNAGWKAHASVGESAEILRTWIAAGQKHAVVLLESGKVIGHISVDPDSEEGRADTRELGCALNPEYQRKGFMTEAVLAAVDYLFGSGSVLFIWACCFRTNSASRGMIEKCGFRFMQEDEYSSASLMEVIPSYEYRMTKDEWQSTRAPRVAQTKGNEP